MPHAAILAAAITAGVGTAVAFEVGVFRPWREVNWPNGIAEGLKQEWQEFSDDMKDGFREISGDFRRQRQNRRNQEQQQQSHRRRDSDVEEEMQLRREMDEFSVHEAQSTGLRSRYASEFGDDGPARRRNLQGATSDESLKEDVVSVLCTTEPYRHRKVADNLCTCSQHLGRTSYIDHLDSSTDMYDEAPHASVYHDVSSPLPPLISSQHAEQTLRHISSLPSATQTSTQPSQEMTAMEAVSPTISVQSLSIQDDWQSHNGTISEQADHDDEDSGSASWVQLTDSRPNSPWSDTGMVERR